MQLRRIEDLQQPFCHRSTNCLRLEASFPQSLLKVCKFTADFTLKSVIFPLVVTLWLEFNFPKIESKQNLLKSFISHIFNLLKDNFLNKKVTSFCYCLILVYLGQGFPGHNFNVVITLYLLPLMPPPVGSSKFSTF